jgi:hypothetical protein
LAEEAPAEQVHWLVQTQALKQKMEWMPKKMLKIRWPAGRFAMAVHSHCPTVSIAGYSICIRRKRGSTRGQVRRGKQSGEGNS